MTGFEVFDQIKTLPPGEKAKVVEFLQHEIEERLRAGETPEMLAAIVAASVGIVAELAEGEAELARKREPVLTLI